MSKFAGLALPVDTATRLNLKHPITGKDLADKDGNPAYIELFGPDSEVALAFERKLANSIAEGEPNDYDARERHMVDRLAARTKGWRLLGLDGSPLDVEFSAQNAKELYADRGMRWIRDAVLIYSTNRQNFGKASSES